MNPNAEGGINELKVFTERTEGDRRDSRASLVVIRGEGSLGGPVPSVLVAVTLNSYSVQGIRLITVAISAFPSTLTGAEDTEPLL